MAKRSLAQGLTDLLVGGAGIALILLALVIILARAHPVKIAVLAVLACGLWQLKKSGSARAGEHRRAISIACADNQIKRHRNALVSYFRQSIRGDLFGNEDNDLWLRHVHTFIETQVVPALAARSVAMDGALAAHLADHVDRVVRTRLLSPGSFQAGPKIDAASLTPLEYEQHCAAILSRFGWSVRTTPATGDHGADVIAEKNGRRLVVQCKLYAKPVGNKAVQEAYSARPLYNGDHACVVAPAGFTAQAERAAHSLSVRLLHHDDLGALADDLA